MLVTLWLKLFLPLPLLLLLLQSLLAVLQEDEWSSMKFHGQRTTFMSPQVLCVSVKRCTQTHNKHHNWRQTSSYVWRLCERKRTLTELKKSRTAGVDLQEPHLCTWMILSEPRFSCFAFTNSLVFLLMYFMFITAHMWTVRFQRLQWCQRYLVVPHS